MNEASKIIQTAGLTINTKTGEVTNLLNHDLIRLSPVNIRVLETLINQAQQSVSRQQIFDTVWPNQTISDDALTRCISDLRAQLKPLATTNPLIDTIPKVGYRWSNAIDENAASPKDVINGSIKSPATTIKTALLIIITLMVFGWGLLLLIQLGAKPVNIPLAILPTKIVNQSALTNDFKKFNVVAELKQAIANRKDLQYLSEYALESHQGSPFPYFSHQFGVRWFIESQLSHQQNGSLLTLNLVDAKTALVTYSIQKNINSIDDIKEVCKEFMEFVTNL